MGPVTGLIHRDNLHELFRDHHNPITKDTQYAEMRRAAYQFANAILALTPVCMDQQLALSAVRESLSYANSAIALHGKL
jgi:hypothetical protein